MIRQGDRLADYFTKPLPPVFPTGLRELDDLLRGGVRVGESTMIGGFTGQAKSALGEQMALSMSLSINTLYLALELGEDLTRLRMGAKIARTSLDTFQRTGLDPMTKAELNMRRLTIYQPKARSIAKIEAIVARRAHDIVILDDCRNIEGVMMDGNTSSAHKIAARITELAQEYGVHVIALHQLDPKSFRLGPNDWRFMDSSVFEQRAYNSLTVYRPMKHRGEHSDTLAEIRVRKSRWGPSGKIPYRWVGSTMSFWEFSPEELAEVEYYKNRKGAVAV